MKKPTIKDVAALANVSVGTVSMTLNNSPKISQSTKEQVMLAVQKLGYRRDPFARSLSLSASRTIGFLVPDLTNPFYGELAGTMQQEIEERNYCMMLGLTAESSAQEKKVVDMFLDHGVDGLVIVPVTDPRPELAHLYDLLNRNFPVVFLGTYYAQLPVHCVMSDLVSGSYMITRKLLEDGHDNILLVSGRPELIAFKERIEGFRKAMEEFGKEVRPDNILSIDGLTYEGGYDAIERVYDHKKFDAIEAINDFTAMGIISGLRKKGVRVPEDVSVAGYDDVRIAAIQETPLTTIRQHGEELCAKSLDMLFAQIAGREMPLSPVKVPVTPVWRDSTQKKNK